jgi:hypothetical protein
MIIRDAVRKCVMFLGYRMASGETRLAGTAFLVGRELPDGTSFAYLVTAKHVISGIQSLGLPDVLVRLNMTGGDARWFATRVGEWVVNPSDPSVDLAVLPRVSLPIDVDHLKYPTDRFLTADIVAAERVGVGTDVFLTGLFVKHAGSSRSVPIVRSGTVAAMPGEPVPTSLGSTEAYLIEARSLGGLSGSPVFANLGTVRVVNGTIQVANDPVVYLLGVVHGHFDMRDQGGDGEPLDWAARERINMGIAVVTPVERLAELLRHPVIATEDQRIYEQELQPIQETTEPGSS